VTGSRALKPKRKIHGGKYIYYGVLIGTWCELMPAKIVLSYRRSDSDVITGRIRDNLANHYGEHAVFMDIDSIPLGFDYRQQMRDALSDNKVMIAVIGPKWLGGRGKNARINESNDPVRIELETAFQQGMRIIPVLVSGATMPKAADLPQSLQGLCYINAGEVDGGRDFRQHMSRLIYAIDQILKTDEPSLSKQALNTESAANSGEPSGSSRKWVPFVVAAMACLVVTAAGILTYRSITSTSPDSTLPAAAPGAPRHAAPIAQMSEREDGKDRRGGDYLCFDVRTDHIEDCEAACKAETKCAAWTYVRPAVISPNARCCMKSVIPAASDNTCCVSGTKIR
jgi:hypothetical protein